MSAALPSRETSAPRGYAVVTPNAVKEARSTDDAVLLLDVRTPAEYHSHRIPGARLLPVQELAARWRELDPATHTICICEHGIRSEAAADFLARQGFARVATMRGGMVRWRWAVDRD